MEMFFRHHRLSLTCKGYSRDNKEKCKYFFSAKKKESIAVSRHRQRGNLTFAVKLASACRRNNLKTDKKIVYTREIIRNKKKFEEVYILVNDRKFYSQFLY